MFTSSVSAVFSPTPSPVDFADLGLRLEIAQFAGAVGLGYRGGDGGSGLLVSTERDQRLGKSGHRLVRIGELLGALLQHRHRLVALPQLEIRTHARVIEGGRRFGTRRVCGRLLQDRDLALDGLARFVLRADSLIRAGQDRKRIRAIVDR